MGYRSEVVLYVGPEVMPQFMVTMAKCQATRAMCFADHERMIRDYSGIKGSMLFKWGWIKWYDSYPPIIAVNNFLERMEDLTNEDCEEWADEYRFIRFGEDHDDEDVRGYGFRDVCISRTLNF